MVLSNNPVEEAVSCPAYQSMILKSSPHILAEILQWRGIPITPFPMPEMTPATPSIHVAIYSKLVVMEYIPPDTRTYFILADVHKLWCRICLWAEGRREEMKNLRRETIGALS
jgi:hypothetical protein